MNQLNIAELENTAGGWGANVAGGFLGGLTGAGAATVIIDSLELASGPAGWVMFGVTTLGAAAGIAAEY